jgi:hypothetical protein
MSVEAPKPVEETPVVEVSKALPEQPEASTAPADATAAAPADTTETTPAAVEEPVVAAAPEEPKKDEAVVDVVPASEGVLGYKEPTFFKYVATNMGAVEAAVANLLDVGNSSSLSTTSGSKKSRQRPNP